MIRGPASTKDDDDEEEIQAYVYFAETRTAQVHHFYISSYFMEPEHYIEMIHKIRTAPAGDVVYIHLNTGGGILSTGVQIINAMELTQAHVIVSVEGEAHSLGTLVFLSADEFVIHDNCMMMFHNYSGGVYGKGHEQKAQLDATGAWFETMARKKYIPFMSEEEFQSMVDGKDIWMQSDEIRQRLLNMVDVIEKEDGVDGNDLVDRIKSKKS
jgi:ATP-dependent protease ClpP protease subunit